MGCHAMAVRFTALRTDVLKPPNSREIHFSPHFTTELHYKEWGGKLSRKSGVIIREFLL